MKGLFFQSLQFLPSKAWRIWGFSSSSTILKPVPSIQGKLTTIFLYFKADDLFSIFWAKTIHSLFHDFSQPGNSIFLFFFLPMLIISWSFPNEQRQRAYLTHLVTYSLYCPKGNKFLSLNKEEKGNERHRKDVVRDEIKKVALTKIVILAIRRREFCFLSADCNEGEFDHKKEQYGQEQARKDLNLATVGHYDCNENGHYLKDCPEP